MYEVWGKRDGQPKWEYITSFENVKSSSYMLDALDDKDYNEAIILCDNRCIMIKVYEKGKVLRK